MSLVDYASSSSSDDDADIEEKEEEEEEEEENEGKSSEPPLRSTPHSASLNQSSVASSYQRSESVPSSSTASIEKLPDAALLLDSPSLPSSLVNAGDHSSRVAAAMAENASRKRESNGSASSHQRSKLPRGNLLNSINVPRSVAGQLVPPQLTGRRGMIKEQSKAAFLSHFAGVLVDTNSNFETSQGPYY